LPAATLRIQSSIGILAVKAGGWATVTAPTAVPAPSSVAIMSGAAAVQLHADYL
jgi:hypothetical protein